MMIKRCLFLVAMMLPLMGFAQNDAATKARVQSIREIYRQSMTDINAAQKEDSGKRNDALVSLSLVRPGTGASQETLEFYGELLADSAAGDYRNEAFFIRRSYNIAARKYYNEFLFDRQTGDLLFAYIRTTSDEEPDIKIEDRFYFDKGSLAPIWHTATGVNTEKNTVVSQRIVDKYKWQGGDTFFSIVPGNLRLAYHALANNE